MTWKILCHRKKNRVIMNLILVLTGQYLPSNLLPLRLNLDVELSLHTYVLGCGVLSASKLSFDWFSFIHHLFKFSINHDGFSACNMPSRHHTHRISPPFATQAMSLTIHVFSVFFGCLNLPNTWPVPLTRHLT